MTAGCFYVLRYECTYMVRKNVTLFLAGLVLLGGCATNFIDLQEADLITSYQNCADKNGEWTPVRALFPKRPLGEGWSDDFVCRAPTGEQGKSCTKNSQCKAACLAPSDALSGKPAVGVCSAWTRWEEGALLVDEGFVTFPERQLVTRLQQTMYERDFSERKEMQTLQLKQARETWDALKIHQYNMTIVQDCDCVFAEYYGPNRVSTWRGNVAKVVYEGNDREGLHRGDVLTRKNALKLSVNDVFTLLEERLQFLTPDQVLAVNYDPLYGFPTFVYWNNEKQISRDYSQLVFTDFSLN